MNILYDEHTEILKSFNKYAVEYLLIAGYPRTTGAMDIWLKPDNDNKNKILNAFTELGYEESSINFLNGLDFTEVVIFHLGIEPEKMQFLTRVSLLNFDEAYNNRQVSNIEDDFTISFLHINDLILSKINSGRLKDAADVEELQKIQQKRK